MSANAVEPDVAAYVVAIITTVIAIAAAVPVLPLLSVIEAGAAGVGLKQRL